MSLGYFEYNNQNSQEFGLMIDPELTFSSPAVKGEFHEIAGQDGNPYVTDGKLQNVNKSFPAYLDNELSNQNRATEISNWLKNDVGWHELIFSGDPDYVYQAIYTDEYEVTSNLETLGKTILSFVVKPYKFFDSGLIETDLTSSLNNVTNRDARPRLTIRGTGAISIRIGSRVLTMKNVSEGIIVDSLYQLVTSLDGTRPLWANVTSYPLPVIEPGQQTVTITGNVSSVRIIPRWEVVI